MRSTVLSPVAVPALATDYDLGFRGFIRASEGSMKGFPTVPVVPIVVSGVPL